MNNINFKNNIICVFVIIMERNQFKALSDWYNPLTWFGQPSVAPPAFTGTSQDEKSAGLPGWKTNNDSTLSTALKANFTQPFVKAEKTIVNDVKIVEKSISNIAETAEKDLKMISTEIYDAGKWVVKETEIIGDDIATAGRGLYKFGSKTVVFIENYYPFILFAGASYLSARYVNEVKQALA